MPNALIPRDVMAHVRHQSAVGAEINHAAARGIVSALLNGTDEPAHFYRTGGILEGQIWSELLLWETADGRTRYDTLSADDKLAADALGTYLVARINAGDTAPVENWSALTV